MILNDLPQGESVFVDPNTQVYYFAADSQFGATCTHLVSRFERHEIIAIRSAPYGRTDALNMPPLMKTSRFEPDPEIAITIGAAVYYG